MEEPHRGDLVPAITRAVAVLDLLAARDGVPASASDIARELGRPKSSTANLCTALEQSGLVSRRDGGYLLGRKLAELGGRYLSTLDEVTEFYRLCRESRVLAGETVRASILEDLDVLYLARYDGVRPLRLTSNIGDRFPASCTATGKALMADLDPAVLADRLRGVTMLPTLTSRSVGTVSELMVELDAVRRQGWAIDDEETTIGVTCFAVPVGPPRTRARFAVSVTLLTSRLGADVERDDLIGGLQSLADQMGSPLGPR